MSTGPLQTLLLRDVDHGGDEGQPALVAQTLAAFIDAASTSIDIAIYDFRLSDPLAAPVVTALTGAAARGVTVRIGYDAGKPADATADTWAELEADPAPAGTADWVTEHFAGTAVQTEPIEAGSQLMHSKYVIRDATGPAAAVWTGSTNFTDDAWTHQENNIVIVADADVATAYTSDLDELWTAGKISGSGGGDSGTASVGGGTVSWDFAPGDGPAIDSALVGMVEAAKTTVVVAAMVLTSRTLLAALVAALGRGVSLTGIYDAGQMDPIVAQWKSSAGDAQVVADFETVAGHLSAKHSTPYSATGLHNFMHDKILLTEAELATGSYNFSANAERNAENQLRITDPAVLAEYTAYLAAITAAYEPTGAAGDRPATTTRSRPPRLAS